MAYRKRRGSAGRRRSFRGRRLFRGRRTRSRSRRSRVRQPGRIGYRL